MDARLANFRNYRPLSKEAVLSHLADFGLEEVRPRRARRRPLAWLVGGRGREVGRAAVLNHLATLGWSRCAAGRVAGLRGRQGSRAGIR